MSLPRFRGVSEETGSLLHEDGGGKSHGRATSRASSTRSTHLHPRLQAGSGAPKREQREDGGPDYQHGRWHRYPTIATGESAAGSGNDGSALVEVSRSVGAWCSQCIWVSGACPGEVQRMRIVPTSPSNPQHALAAATRTLSSHGSITGASSAALVAAYDKAMAEPLAVAPAPRLVGHDAPLPVGFPGGCPRRSTTSRTQ
jgi:hypothetical protein